MKRPELISSFKKNYPQYRLYLKQSIDLLYKTTVSEKKKKIIYEIKNKMIKTTDLRIYSFVELKILYSSLRKFFAHDKTLVERSIKPTIKPINSEIKRTIYTFDMSKFHKSELLLPLTKESNNEMMNTNTLNALNKFPGSFGIPLDTVQKIDLLMEYIMAVMVPELSNRRLGLGFKHCRISLNRQIFINNSYHAASKDNFMTAISSPFMTINKSIEYIRKILLGKLNHYMNVTMDFIRGFPEADIALICSHIMFTFIDNIDYIVAGNNKVFKEINIYDPVSTINCFWTSLGTSLYVKKNNKFPLNPSSLGKRLKKSLGCKNYLNLNEIELISKALNINVNIYNKNFELTKSYINNEKKEKHQLIIDDNHCKVFLKNIEIPDRKIYFKNIDEVVKDKNIEKFATFKFETDKNFNIIGIELLIDGKKCYFRDIDKFLYFIFEQNIKYFYAKKAGRFENIIIIKHVLSSKFFSIIGNKSIEQNRSWILLTIKYKNKIVQLKDGGKILSKKFTHQKMLELQKDIYEQYKVDIVKLISIGSVALRIERSNFYVKNLYYLPYILDKKIRKTYHGGRTKAFVTGIIKSPIFVFDFASEYAKVGSSFLPKGKCKIVYINEKINNDDFLNLLNGNKFYFIKAIINQKENILPVLGDGRLIFKNGEITGYFVGNEFDECIKYGGKIIYVYWIIIFDSYGKIFKNFYDSIYKLKKDGKVAGKLLLTNHYGMYGKRYKIPGIVIQNYFPSNYLCSGRLFDYKKIGKKYISRIEKITNYNSNVAIASWITASARLDLYKLCKKIKNVNGKIYYIDTDCIHTNLDLRNIEDFKYYFHDEIGHLKLEAFGDKGLYISEKIYSIYKKNIIIKNAHKGITKENVSKKMYDILNDGKYFLHRQVEIISNNNFELITRIVNKKIKKK
jgi:hypothetical protein